MDRDNQQETVTDMELGWFAGIVDGEGSICLQVHKRAAREKRKQGLVVTPKVIIANTDHGIIEACVSILGKLGVGRYVLHTRSSPSKLCPDKNGTYKDISYVHVSGLKRIKKLLDAISPCLYGEKKERARKLLAFIDRRFSQADVFDVGGNYKYDAEDVRLIMDFVRSSRSPQIDHIGRLLNEHTRNAPHSTRAMMCSDLTGDSKSVREIDAAV